MASSCALSDFLRRPQYNFIRAEPVADRNSLRHQPLFRGMLELRIRPLGDCFRLRCAPTTHELPDSVKHELRISRILAGSAGIVRNLGGGAPRSSRPQTACVEDIKMPHLCHSCTVWCERKDRRGPEIIVYPRGTGSLLTADHPNEWTNPPGFWAWLVRREPPHLGSAGPTGPVFFASRAIVNRD
jgi:hypothetical protein